MTKSSIVIPEDLERRLLDCGRSLDAPPPAALRRTLAHVELAAAAGLLATTAPMGAAAATTEFAATAHGVAAVTSAAAGTSATKVATASLTMKWFMSGLAVGVASTGVLGAGVVAQQHWHLPASAASVARVPNSGIPAVAASPRTHRAPANVATAASADSEVETAAPPINKNPPSPRLAPQWVDPVREQADRTGNSAPPTKRGSPLSPELARELALLDHARAALERRDAANAAHWLQQHTTQFPNGQLAPEAAALRAAVEEQLSPMLPTQIRSPNE